MVGQSMSTIKRVGVCQDVGFIKKIQHLDLLKSYRHAARPPQGASWRMPTYIIKRCSNYFLWWIPEGRLIEINIGLSKCLNTAIIADVRLLQREIIYHLRTFWRMEIQTSFFRHCSRARFTALSKCKQLIVMVPETFTGSAAGT